MNNRTRLCVLGGMAAVAAIIGFVIIAAWGGRGDAGVEARTDAGSLLHPRVVEEAHSGYVLAELYQDVHLDVESGVYYEDGVLLGRYWNHEPTPRPAPWTSPSPTSTAATKCRNRHQHPRPWMWSPPIPTPLANWRVSTPPTQPPRRRP